MAIRKSASSQVKLKVALLGFGGMGHFHATQYADQKECELIAIVDKDPKKFQQLAAKINLGESGDVSLKGIHQYASYEEMMAMEKPDMVDICLPCDLHAEYAIRALQDGLHVLCEKPMARSVKEADQMIAAAKKAKKKLMIAQCLRFDPVYGAFKKIHDSGKYGKLLRMQAQRLSEAAKGTGNWYRDAKRSGGAVLDLHLHDVDFLQYLFGTIPASVSTSGVFTAGTGRASGGLDELLTHYDFGNGALVAAEGSWLHPQWFCNLSAVYEKATVYLEGNKITIYQQDKKNQVKEIKGKKNGYWEEIAYFAKCVLAKKDPVQCLPESTRDSIRIAFAEEKSAAEHKIVKL